MYIKTMPVSHTHGWCEQQRSLSTILDTILDTNLDTNTTKYQNYWECPKPKYKQYKNSIKIKHDLCEHHTNSYGLHDL